MASKKPTDTRMPAKELGERISAHLKRLEEDPVYNVPNGKYKTVKLYMSGAWWSGRKVHVTYVGYQGSAMLTRDEAEKYLAWLDAGNQGRHYAVCGR